MAGRIFFAILPPRRGGYGGGAGAILAIAEKSKNKIRDLPVLSSLSFLLDLTFQNPKNDRCFDRLSKALSILDGGAIVFKEIEVEAALANCRALIDQINVGLSAGNPFVNVSSAAELLFYLEFAASALQRDATKFRATPTLTWH
jgi:hypothetical protein